MEIAGEPGGALQSELRGVAQRAVERAQVSAVRARRIAYAATAAYAALFVLAAVVHFLAFHAAFADLGTMTQAVWATAHGHFLETTSLAGQNRPRLGVHVDPFLVLLVPLWWIWSSPLLLAVVQAVGVATGALPVFWLARKHLRSDRAGVHFALAYLLYPATQFNAFTVTSGFHAVSMAVPLVLFAVWFLDEERLLPFAAFALAAASTKEEIPLAVGCLGIWYAVRKGHRLVGLGIFVLGLAVTVVDFFVIIPHFSASGIDPFAARYSDVGTTPGGILRTAFTNPGSFVSAMATGHKLVYVVMLLGPFLGLWLLEPLLFLGAVPDLAVNLLSGKSDQTVVAYHWTAGIVPFTVAASIFGAAKLRKDHDRLSMWVLVGAASLAAFSPIYLAVARGDVGAAFRGGATRAAKVHALDLIPTGAPVTASNQLASYLSARRHIYVFPVVRRSDWLLLDRNDNTYSDARGYRRAVVRLAADARWERVYVSHGIEVLRRRQLGRS